MGLMPSIRNTVQIIVAFTAMFAVLTLLLKPSQLMGLTDQGYWINYFYNVLHSGEPVTSLQGRHNFTEHSLLLLISPLAYIKNPILLSYVLYYLTYLSWFFIFYILNFNKFSLIKFVQSFLLFFCSTTILFHYGLNFNGWNSIYLSPPILMMVYYFAFIRKQYNKSILLYIPLLFLKVQFWFIYPFFLAAIYLHSKDKRYIYQTLLLLIVFFIYIRVRPFLFGESGTDMLLDLSYGHIFNGDITAFIKIFLSTIKLKLILITAFFVQFVFLIDWKNLQKRDAYIYLVLIFPIFSYCILSDRTVMSYWTHEHYVLPVLPVIFLMFMKYGIITKMRVIAFILVNIALILGIVSLKQPWQFKYYQDESQLEDKIKPLLNLSYKDHILSDDRTGLYFSSNQINFLKYIEDKAREPKYIILNSRYLYYTNNIKRDKSKKTISSFKFVNDYEKNLDGYGIIYLNYPFIVYENKHKSDIKINAKNMNEWDVKFIENNKFL